MHITLLTHQRERGKSSNTGSLVVDVLGASADVIVWERTKPSSALLRKISQASTALLYPSDQSECITESLNYEHCVVIDGTWQEAQKIYNKSPYLHALPAIKIQSEVPSAYNLRRNQRPGCLCTAECVIAVLMKRGLTCQADDLQSKLNHFLGCMR